LGDILDYISWRGDLSWARSPFCPVDALALSALAYIHFEGVVPEGLDSPVPLRQAAERYLALPPGRRGRFRCGRDLALLRALGEAPRFAGAELCCRAGRFAPEEETQFAALAVLLGDGSAYLAFRGTDATLVGWKEDFNMSFMDLVPAQILAAEYAGGFAGGFPGPLRLGGHSKGGNLAVVGAALCPVKVRDRVEVVYSFDGPGFNPYLLARPGYQELRTRIRSFVPRSSVVGLLLTHEEPHTVVQSSQQGLFQHDLYSWQILGPDFLRLEEVDAGSRLIDRALKDWLAGLTRQERETVVDTLYGLLSCQDAKMIREALEPANLASALRAVREADPKDLLTVASSLARLARAALRAL
jgi:hypothetical protein